MDPIPSYLLGINTIEKPSIFKNWAAKYFGGGSGPSSILPCENKKIQTCAKDVVS
jgi:hypothetical protein